MMGTRTGRSNFENSSNRWSNEKSWTSTVFCGVTKQFLNFMVASISLTVYQAFENLKVIIVADVNPAHVFLADHCIKSLCCALFFNKAVTERLAKHKKVIRKHRELH